MTPGATGAPAHLRNLQETGDPSDFRLKVFYDAKRKKYFIVGDAVPERLVSKKGGTQTGVPVERYGPPENADGFHRRIGARTGKFKEWLIGLKKTDSRRVRKRKASSGITVAARQP